MKLSVQSPWALEKDDPHSCFLHMPITFQVEEYFKMLKGM